MTSRESFSVGNIGKMTYLFAYIYETEYRIFFSESHKFKSLYEQLDWYAHMLCPVWNTLLSDVDGAPWQRLGWSVIESVIVYIGNANQNKNKKDLQRQFSLLFS